MWLIGRIVHILAIPCYAIVFIEGLLCLPVLFGTTPVVVMSGSMEPSYKVGSVVYYRKTPKEELRVGDVITFDAGENKVTHRIASIRDAGFVTKGDANNSNDSSLVSYEAVCGKVMPVPIPLVGYLAWFTTSHAWIWLIIASVLFFEFVFNNGVYRRRYRR